MEALAFSTPCSTMKTILVQYGSFNRLVEVDCSPEKTAQASERTLLIQEIRQAFGERISSEDRITLQLKHVEWDGVFVDYFGDEIQDKSMMRLVVEKAEVCLYALTLLGKDVTCSHIYCHCRNSKKSV